MSRSLFFSLGSDGKLSPATAMEQAVLEVLAVPDDYTDSGALEIAESVLRSGAIENRARTGILCRDCAQGRHCCGAILGDLRHEPGRSQHRGRLVQAHPPQVRNLDHARGDACGRGPRGGWSLCGTRIGRLLR